MERVLPHGDHAALEGHGATVAGPTTITCSSKPSGGNEARDQAQFEEAVGAAIEAEFVADAIVATSSAQRDSLWALRDDVEGFFRMGMPVTFDVSLPVADMEGYVDEVIAAARAEWPAYRRFVFGHLGDGNLHIIAAGPPSKEARHGIERCVYEPLAARGGSVSAEHGIGLEKQPWLALCRTPGGTRTDAED